MWKFTAWLFVITFFICGVSYADTDQVKKAITTQLSFKNDTIAVRNFTEEKYNKNWWDNKNMPWIVAAFSSLVTVVLTVTVTHFNSKRNEKVSMINIDKQIKASGDIAIKQLQNSNNLALMEFKATLNAENRQEWINEVRHCISEYITQCRMLNIECQNEAPSVEKIDAYFVKITYSYYKLLLLLKHDKTEHTEVINALNELSGLMDVHILNTRHHINSYDNAGVLQKQNALIKAGTTLLYFEWNKIQAMENN